MGSKYTKILSASDCNLGDHIRFTLEAGTISDAIVVQTLNGDRVKIIHMGPLDPDGPVTVQCPAVVSGVREDEVDLGQYISNRTLKRVNYRTGSCNTPEQVVILARRQIGVTSPSLSSKQFAKWCKTHRSQVSQSR